MNYEEILAILKKVFVIEKIIIENTGEESYRNGLIIDVKIHTREIVSKIEHVFQFYNASTIEIPKSYQTLARQSLIVIEDISSAQLEDKNFVMEILDNGMTFYCEKIYVIN